MISDKNDLGELKGKTFLSFCFDITIGIWYGDNSWAIATWTLSIELVATFMVYLIAQTVIEYRGRFYIYGIIIMSFLGPYYIEKWGFTPTYKLAKTHTDAKYIYHYPMFIFGVIIADLEMMPNRPLDMFRDWWWPYATLRNIFLLFIGISFGGHRGDSCIYMQSGPCLYWQIVTLDEWIDKDICMYIGGLAVIFLALFSEGAQWVLGSCFFQFFGRISYSLYLVHALFLFYAENDIVRNLYERGDYSYDMAVFIAWATMTPILIGASYLCTILFDEPYKDFAYEIDMAFRHKPPKTRNAAGGAEIASEKSDEKKFVKNSWKFFALFFYMLVVYISTEAYSYYTVYQSDNDYDN